MIKVRVQKRTHFSSRTLKNVPYQSGRICHELLNLSKGLDTGKKRCFDVEPVFANIKQNHGFRRFALRGVKQKLK